MRETFSDPEGIGILDERGFLRSVAERGDWAGPGRGPAPAEAQEGAVRSAWPGVPEVCRLLAVALSAPSPGLGLAWVVVEASQALASPAQPPPARSKAGTIAHESQLRFQY